MKKGFTLVEILAIIAVMGVLLIIVTPNVYNMVQNSKEKNYDTLIEQIEEATKLYVSRNIEGIMAEIIQNGFYSVTLKQLVDGGLIKEAILVNSVTGESIPLSRVVKIMRDESLVLVYCYEDKDCPDPYIPLWNCGDTLIDSRDNQEYSTIEMGTQCWMAEDLMYTGNGCLSNSWNEAIPLNACRLNGNSAGTIANATSPSVHYQWGVTMNWDGANPVDPTGLAGTQGICPNGWGVPSDNDFKILEMHLGMTQAQADATNWRGTSEGDRLKANPPYWCNSATGCASSGFNALPAGYRNTTDSLYYVGTNADWWSSSPSGSNAWSRFLFSGNSLVARVSYSQAYGFSVRCLLHKGPSITFNPNGNETYAKTRSSIVTVTADDGVNASSLRHQWTTSTTPPTAGSFTLTFTNGSSIPTPVDVTGDYYLWILATDNSDNTKITGSNRFRLDNTNPVITITGDNPATIVEGSIYTDAGANHTDAHSGIAITHAPVSTVNPAVVGTYTVTYSSTDNAGNTATAIRTVHVIEPSGVYTFDFINDSQTWIVPKTSRCRIEVWGGRGHSEGTHEKGGKGGYAYGEIELTQGQTLNVFVGGSGTITAGGWNGGGVGGLGRHGRAPGGGGATDVRIGGVALANRVIVGAGGGGQSFDGHNGDVGDWRQGGAGGGTSGLAGQGTYGGAGGTQSTGFALGQGGAGRVTSDTVNHGANGGGGGGYYGGFGGNNSGNTTAGDGGGGGSSYVGGMINDGTRGTIANLQIGNGFARITCPPVHSIPANAPQLANNNMIPVKWDGTRWVKADVNNPSGANQWYDYDNFMWANAVTVSESGSGTGSDGIARQNRTHHVVNPAGTPISIDDILTFFVWIPRYKFAVSTGSGEREINVIFETGTTTSGAGTAVGTDYLTHPAFTFGSAQLSGFWAGKFNMTGTSSVMTIKPNLPSLRSLSISQMFNLSREMQALGNIYGIYTSTIDTHMMKNVEWGAIAYLSHSRFGKFGNPAYTGVNNEIWINPNTNYTTGCAGTSASAGGTTSCNQYHTVNGQQASTTGNVYGVYDMNGGAYDYVMGVFGNGTGSSGFGTMPDAKYYDRYLITTGVKGDATNADGTQGWYSDHFRFPSESGMWVLRSGAHSDGALAGIFMFSDMAGGSNNMVSFKVVIAPNP
jgi:uncharacterized protein (TIGR02145 family)